MLHPFVCRCRFTRLSKAEQHLSASIKGCITARKWSAQAQWIIGNKNLFCQ